MADVQYPIGTVLKIRCSTYWHYGISDGAGGVIHNSKKRRQVHYDSLTEFAEGRAIVVSEITSTKPTQAYAYAAAQVGRPYNLFSQNCEQFVREAHGLSVECTQFQQCLLAFAGGYIALNARLPVLRMAGIGLLLGAVTAPSEQRPYRRAVKGAKLAAAGSMWLAHWARKLTF
ncbi:lecithin retinol acyltransferase family protein [Photobacterium sp. TY1-4]|uniref:lecithin retinol acyltransferase family protein n=1 Tax=Photobacterium sp. TY1-4 TaxID=2899122 RepID=UPI0021BEC573|nr:lecithin retinol acyltransferase family protein [Photobacterium sp. TY1-4]UXI02670.1 lecithin retinol acyltransferase family protein [Photobacterium sp. TY1-4]